jgi:hypothetical protein
MDQDVVDRMDSAGIPSALKAALQDLRYQVDTLLPHLSCNQHRIAFLIGRVIEKAAHVEPETHWWEAVLDLIAKAADGHSKAGQFQQTDREQGEVRMVDIKWGCVRLLYEN